MALLWIDGFEGYGITSTPSGIVTRYPDISTSNMSVQAGRVTGYCISNNSTCLFTTPALTQDPTLIVGCAFNFQNQAGSYGIISLYDNAVLGINVAFNYTGSTIVTKLGASTLNTTTLTRSFLSSMWYYCEIKVYCHASIGIVEVHINGVMLVSLSGVGTRQGTDAFHNIVRISLNYSAVDDFYICDGSGIYVNDFQGVCRVLGILPNADTAIVQWAPNAGILHYARVDENPSDVATTFILGSTQSQTDLFIYPSLIGINTIAGLQITTQAALLGGMCIILESLIVSNSVTDLGPDSQITSTSYNDMFHISMTDPNTGLPWTVANLAAAQIGVKVM